MEVAITNFFKIFQSMLGLTIDRGRMLRGCATMGGDFSGTLTTPAYLFVCRCLFVLGFFRVYACVVVCVCDFACLCVFV